MIAIREAVKAALGFAQELYGLHGAERLTLEEVEPTEDERFWMVTLGIPAALQPVELSPSGTAVSATRCLRWMRRRDRSSR